MSKIEIYTSGLCGYCHAAKELLKKKGAAFEEIDVTFSPAKRKEMAERAGRSSVPQIWINGEHVGGCDELYALDASGKLDPMLAESA
jgi:glutaredoxin 3